MDRKSAQIWTTEHSLLYAQTSSACLGVGLVLWGFAPLVIERIVSGEAPTGQLLTANSAVVLTGLAFLLAASCMRRRRWAAWLSFALSAILAAAGIVLTTLTGLHLSSSFVSLLSAATCFASWLAIDAQNKPRAAPAVRRAHAH